MPEGLLSEVQNHNYIRYEDAPADEAAGMAHGSPPPSPQAAASPTSSSLLASFSPDLLPSEPPAQLSADLPPAELPRPPAGPAHLPTHRGGPLPVSPAHLPVAMLDDDRPVPMLLS